MSYDQEKEMTFFLNQINRPDLSLVKSSKQWIKRAAWASEERILSLDLVSPNTTLEHAMKLHVFLPQESADKPFFYCGSESPLEFSLMVEALNVSLANISNQRPQLSLLGIADTVTKFVRQAESKIWTLSVKELRVRVENRIVKLIRESVEGSDQLISLLFFAASCYRRHTIFEPFPCCFRVDQGEKNFGKLCDCMQAIPACKDINNTSLQAVPLGTIQLLQWVLQILPARLQMAKTLVASNVDPAHTPLLKYKEGHPACPTYVMKVDLPEDPYFDKLVKKYGKKLAFHGSPIENFHSILHNGLKNMSGTRHMSTGAAFGDGIYLAQDLKVAHSFTKGGVKGWHKSMFNTLLKDPDRKCTVSFRCVIACEVINHPDNVLKVEGGNGDEAYYVVPNEAHVRGCFLLFYQDVGSDTTFQSGYQTWAFLIACIGLVLGWYTRYVT